MDFDQKQLLNQEDYLAKEKLTILTYNILLSFLSILFFIAEIISSFLLDSLYSTSIPLFLGLLSIFGLVNAFFMLIWSIYQRRKLSISDEKWGENTDSVFARIVLISSIFLFFGLITLSVDLHLWTSRGFDLFVAEHVSDEVEDFVSQWSILSNFTDVFSCVNLLILIYMIYASFVCCGSPNTIRILLYEAGFLQILFGFLVLNYVKLIFQYDENSKIAQFLSLSLYGILSFFIIIVMLGSIVIYVINYKRSRSGYLMCGALLIILTVIIIGLGGSIYRESLVIHNAFRDDCKIYLSDLQYDDISAYGCIPKYSEYGIEYMNCTDADQVLVWEDVINGEENVFKNSIGCLNMNCCNVVGDIYELNLLKLESFNIAFLTMTFLSISACFFLTNKYSGERTLKKILEYLYMVFLFILVIIGIISLFLFQADIPHEKEMISVNSLEFVQSSVKENYTLNSQFIATGCSLITDYDPVYNLSDFYSNDSNSGVRTIILTTNADIWYDNKQNFSDIQVFDKDMASVLFPGLSFSEKDILIFQGKTEKMEKFVNESLYLCPYSILTPMYLEYFIAAVNLSSNTADNSTLQWASGTNFESFLQTTTTISHLNLVNTTEDLSLVSNLTDLQTRLNAIKFGDITIGSYSISSETVIANISLKIYSGTFTSCSSSAESALLEVFTNDSGLITVYNLPYGEYTIIGSNSLTKSNCLFIDIQARSVEKVMFFNDLLEINEISVVLEWKDSIDLNLFGALEFSNETCIVSYFNEECTSLSFKSLNIGQYNAQMVKITVLGAYNYLFFVKRELSWVEYQQTLQNQTDLNSDFLNAEFELKAYVHEIQFPVADLTYEGSNTNSTLVNATSVAFLAFCVDGANSDVLNAKNSFWSGNETFPKANTECSA